MLKQKKMSLFDAPPESVLVHACNAQGVWGSGIAVSFKALYPQIFEKYHSWCVDRRGKKVGDSPIFYDESKDHYIGCLITSDDFGNRKDSPEEILVNTTLALEMFCKQNLNMPVYSNKFNSGYFGVPWQETEKILQVFIKRYNMDWTVCEI